MKLSNAYARWNGPTKDRPTGQFFVTDGRSGGRSADLKNGFGVGQGDWSEVSDAERRKRLRLVFTVAVKKHGVSEALARAALAQIEDVQVDDLYFVEVNPKSVVADLGSPDMPN